VAIGPSRQFEKHTPEAKVDAALKRAKIANLNAITARTMQEVSKNNANLYGCSGKL
jgi:hypothetical protein